MAWILAPKKILISAGVALVVGLALRLSVPLDLEFSTCHLPLIWASLLSWLKPPYLYLVVNGIIIGIAASSRFHHNHHHDGSERLVSDDDPTTPTEEISSELTVYHSTEATHQQKREEATDEVTKAVVLMNGFAEEEDEEEVDDDDDDDEALGRSRSMGNQTKRIYPAETLLMEYCSPAEKPLVTARFGGHRKRIKAGSDGGSGRTRLRVAKPKRHETMENTWKAITEGRTMPLSWQTRQCDTWENHGRQIDFPDDQPSVKKSETFKDRTNQQLKPSPSSSNSKLRKEPSLSQDELNRRVEAFINKFNEEMRLQRLESLNQYEEMINRGASPPINQNP